jgi:hypothetical protein
MAKNKTKLDALASEAKMIDPPAPEASNEGPAPAPDAPMMATGPSQAMCDLCRLPVIAFGAAITRNYRVANLDTAEVDRISAALAGVLHAHGVSVQDPRVAAWLTFGGAIAMAAQPRFEEAAANAAKIANDPAPEPEAKGDALAA